MKVKADMSMSLDGFIAGPNAAPENPLGDEGHRLHEWVYGLASWREPHGLSGGEKGQDSDIMAESFQFGAVLMGRKMFDEGQEPWGEIPPFHTPVFVVTHRAREPIVREGGTTFVFVDGIDGGLAQAREAAGEQDVSVAGGVNIIQQLIRDGLLDELQIHLVPMLLGGGTRLLGDLGPNHTLEIARAIASPRVTHVKYRLTGQTRKEAS